MTSCGPEETDVALVDRFLGGDPHAFDALVSRYERRIYSLCLRLSGHPGDAEDILQDTFMQVFRKLRTFRGEAKFSTWLYRVATNAALMHRRKARDRKMESLEQYLPEFRRDGRHKRIDVDYSAAARIEAHIQKKERTKLLLAAIARLPATYRKAVVMCDLEELDSHQVAEVLRVSPQTLRQRLHRGRLMLRGYLDAIAHGRHA